MANKVILQPAPHIRDNITTQSVMRHVLIALFPAFVMSVVLFGYRALTLTLVCIASCMLFEYLFRKLIKEENTLSDLSAVVTGTLLAFNLPVTLPYWMAVAGCFAAIVVVKQLFGGIGENFVNPAIGGRVVLLMAFSQPMTKWLIPSGAIGNIETVAGATPLTLIAAGNTDQLPDALSMLMGIRGGSLGETCAAALIIGGIYLIWKGIITPSIPVSFLATVLILSFAFGQDPVMQLLSGGVLLGAIFMATDYVSSPLTEKGRVIFGIGCGLFTMLIRVFGSYPEGVSFAILFMNILTPHIDKLTRIPAFGGVKE